MQIKDFVKDIQVAFPNAEIGRIFFAKQNILLEEQYGFTPGNTRFAEGACCDEINEPEYQLLEHYWGERFKFGGLAGSVTVENPGSVRFRITFRRWMGKKPAPGRRSAHRILPGRMGKNSAQRSTGNHDFMWIVVGCCSSRT